MWTTVFLAFPVLNFILARKDENALDNGEGNIQVTFQFQAMFSWNSNARAYVGLISCIKSAIKPSTIHTRALYFLPQIVNILLHHHCISLVAALRLIVPCSNSITILIKLVTSCYQLVPNLSQQLETSIANTTVTAFDLLQLD